MNNFFSSLILFGSLMVISTGAIEASVTDLVIDQTKIKPVTQHINCDIKKTSMAEEVFINEQKTKALNIELANPILRTRLSTGEKVNSAIQNPSSYYTAKSLSNRICDYVLCD